MFPLPLFIAPSIIISNSSSSNSSGRDPCCFSWNEKGVAAFFLPLCLSRVRIREQAGELLLLLPSTNNIHPFPAAALEDIIVPATTKTLLYLQHNPRDSFHTHTHTHAPSTHMHTPYKCPQRHIALASFFSSLFYSTPPMVFFPLLLHT